VGKVLIGETKGVCKMLTISMRGAFLSTFLIVAVPAMADSPMPGAMGSGSAMVDANGMTLYTYEKDVDGKSMCNGGCATTWIPLAVGENVTASGGWAIVTRDDGSKMWAYLGHPVYRYSSDKAAGDAGGDAKDGFHVASGKDSNSTTDGSASAAANANPAAAAVNTDAAATTKSGKDANSTTNGASTPVIIPADDAAAAAAAAATASGKDSNSTTSGAGN
jgi:predicted lipoprotein with Yx(FWY)xxD motif